MTDLEFLQQANIYLRNAQRESGWRLDRHAVLFGVPYRLSMVFPESWTNMTVGDQINFLLYNTTKFMDTSFVREKLALHWALHNLPETETLREKYVYEISKIFSTRPKLLVVFLEKMLEERR